MRTIQYSDVIQTRASIADLLLHRISLRDTDHREEEKSERMGRGILVWDRHDCAIEFEIRIIASSFRAFSYPSVLTFFYAVFAALWIGLTFSNVPLWNFLTINHFDLCGH